MSPLRRAFRGRRCFPTLTASRRLSSLLLFLLTTALSTEAIPNYALSLDIRGKIPTSSQRSSPSRFGEQSASLRRFKRAADDYDVQKCLSIHGIEMVTAELNSTEAFWDASQSDNMRHHWHPEAIVYPRTAQEVSDAVSCASSQDVAVSARSGGHSFAGFGSGGQDGSLIVDMKHFDYVQVAADKKTAYIGSGTRLGDVVKALWSAGELGMPHGTCPTVGTGGHALCGGFGPTSRHWGMATDNLIEAQVVLAEGSIVTATDDNEHRELLWGLKGAGSNFGIVTDFRFRVHDASGSNVFLEYRWSPSIRNGADAAKVVMGLQDVATDASLPSELGFHVSIQPAQSSDPAGGVLAIHLRGIYMASLTDYKVKVFDSLVKKHLSHRGASLPDSSVEKELPYQAVMEEWDDFGKPGDKLDTLAERLTRNNYLARTSLAMGQKGFTLATLTGVFETLYKHAVLRSQTLHPTSTPPNWQWNVYLELFGGSNAAHASATFAAASSFPHRDALWLIQSSVGTLASRYLGSDASDFIQSLDDLWISALDKDGIQRRAYSCYTDVHLPTDKWKEMYYGDDVHRLEQLKSLVDPGRTFRNPQSLDVPLSSTVFSSAGADRDQSIHPLPR